MNDTKKTVKEPNGPYHAFDPDETGKTLCGILHIGWVIQPPVEVEQFIKSKCCVHCLTKWVMQQQENMGQEVTDEAIMSVHRDIKQTLSEHGFRYETGSYSGVGRAYMNFRSGKTRLRLEISFIET